MGGPAVSWRALPALRGDFQRLLAWRLHRETMDRRVRSAMLVLARGMTPPITPGY